MSVLSSQFSNSTKDRAILKVKCTKTFQLKNSHSTTLYNYEKY